MPSRYAPEDLFRHRPLVNRQMSPEEMEQAIMAALANPLWPPPIPEMRP